MEIKENQKTEIPVSLEKPKYSTNVSLPDIHVGLDKRIKLGMHTDSMQTLLKTLLKLPDFGAVKIEGRVLTASQRKTLEEHPSYIFFLSSRFVRSQATDEISIALPNDLTIPPEEAGKLLQTPFSPSSLASEIGYKVGYLNTADLVKNWQAGKLLPTDLLSILAGVNQFSIGSDTLSQARLAEISMALQTAFFDQERLNNVPTMNSNMIKSFNIISLSSALKYNNKIVTDYTIIKPKIIFENFIKKYPKEDIILTKTNYSNFEKKIDFPKKKY